MVIMTLCECLNAVTSHLVVRSESDHCSFIFHVFWYNRFLAVISMLLRNNNSEEFYNFSKQVSSPGTLYNADFIVLFVDLKTKNKFFII